MPRGLFITGTDTGVGKTVVSALLTLNLPGSWSYWKPIQSGMPPLAPSTDRADVAAWTGLPPERLLPEAFRLALPASPHVSAAAENVTIAMSALARPGTAGPLIVEGAGGILVPINGHETMLDLMAALAFPVVLVTRTALGTINHTLLSLAALRQRGLTIAGLVLNGEPVPTTTATLRAWGGVPLLAELLPLAAVTPPTLTDAYTRSFNRWSPASD